MDASLGQFIFAGVGLVLMGGGLGWGAHKLVAYRTPLTPTEAHQKAVELAASLATANAERLRAQEQHLEDIRTMARHWSEGFVAEVMGLRGIMSALAGQIEHASDLQRERQAMVLERHDENQRELRALNDTQRAIERELQRVVATSHGPCREPCCVGTRDRR